MSKSADDNPVNRAQADSLPRSPELLSPSETGLLLVDVQTALMKVQPHAPRIIWNCRRLLDGARVLDLPVIATEQNPAKLGATVEILAERLATPASPKMAFSCGERGDLFDAWRERGVRQALLCGIEAHVCIMQSAFDLLGAGFQVFVAVDAVGSRHSVDYKFALRRMESAGATLTTTESALCELCVRAGTPQFREISRLAKEISPEESAPPPTRPDDIR